MLGNGLPRRLKILRNRIRRHGLYRDERNDRPSRRVGYGLENVSFHNYEQQYATKRLHVSSATERFRELFFALLFGQ